jgi:hypothetical protein
VLHRVISRSFISVVVLTAALAVCPSLVLAQRGGGGGGGGGTARPAPGPAPGNGGGRPYPAAGPRTTVHVGVGVGYGYGWGYPRGAFYPWYGAWGPYWGYAPYYWGGYWGWGGYGYGGWGPWGPYPYGIQIDDQTASLRLEIAPREAQVFVDGYAAGTVNDYDGVFQRLRLRPGGHEITVYLNGFRTVSQTLYLGSNSDQKVKYTLEKLGPGETSEPPPQPVEPEVTEPRDEPPPPPRRQPAPRPAPRPAEEPPPPAPRNEIEVATNFGTLSIRVQPGDAEILVDGERWTGPAGPGALQIRMAEGRHKIEVRKDGFEHYTEDVLIRRGATLALNVSLTRGGGSGGTGGVR